MSVAENTWKLWQYGATLREIREFTPRLASWEKSTAPAQIRVREYLRELAARLSPLPQPAQNLFLHMDVDVEKPERLEKHYDLENYLTPLFGSSLLKPSSVVLVSARKRVGGGSLLRIGRAVSGHGPTNGAWHYFGCRAGKGYTNKSWKQNLHDRLLSETPSPLPTGKVAVRMAWRCTPNRNWTALWKPTGDAMGPALGYASENTLFNPRDDRITYLEYHLNAEVTQGYDVDVGMWWTTDND